MKRVFIAIDISEEARQRAAAYIDALRREFPGPRVGWECPEKLHITLKFLGEVQPDQLPKIESVVADVAVRHISFAMQLAGTGTFSLRGEPRILWLGLAHPVELSDIAARVEEGCSQLGFEPEKRRFSPHLTIARLRDPAGYRGLAAAHRSGGFEPVSFTVTELAIYESQLRPGGSIYTKLAAFSMNQS